MILVRVKRPRDAEDLDQIYMDYDTEGNFKRPKLVTEKDSMMSALSMFQIGASKPTPVAFSLGQKQNVVKLNKVSLGGLAQLDKGQDENRIQKICIEKLNQTRQKYRTDKIAQRRRERIKGALKEKGLDFKQKDLDQDDKDGNLTDDIEDKECNPNQH